MKKSILANPHLMARRAISALLVLCMVIALSPAPYFQAAAGSILDGVTLTLSAPENTIGAQNSIVVSTTTQLTLTATGGDLTGATTTYSSSAPTIATVSNTGLVTATNTLGKSTITATAIEGGVTKTATIDIATIGVSLNLNGNFEATGGTNGFGPTGTQNLGTGWQIANFGETADYITSRDDVDKHSGVASLKVLWKNPHARVNQILAIGKGTAFARPVDPGKLYEVTGWYKIQDNAGTKINLAVDQYYYTSNGTSLVTNGYMGKTVTYATNSTSWLPFRAPIYGPMDASTAYLNIRVLSVGTVASIPTDPSPTWNVDDININEVTFDSLNIVYSEIFYNM